MRAATVFLCIPHGHHAANLLRTDVLPHLLASPELRLVILSPLVQDRRFVDEFEHERVQFETLHPYDPPYVEQAVYSILQERFARRTGIESARIEVERKRLLSGPRQKRSAEVVRRFLASLPLTRPAWLRAVELVAPDGLYGSLFDRHRPDVVVTATAGLQFIEMPLIRQALRRRIPVMGVDLSWDHLTLKSQTLQRVDRLVVWNEQMRQEAIVYHRYDPRVVEVSGVPQFDAYFRRDGVIERIRFLEKIGGVPDRKLITFTTVPQSRHPYQVPVIQAIQAALAEGRLGPAQFLIRIHPQDEVEPYAKFCRRPGVIVEKPFREVGIAGCNRTDPTREDRAHQANTLAHSDVLVNFASSMTIEACIFDVPVVNFVCADPSAPLALSPRRYYRFEHYRRILEAEAVRLADTPEEVVMAIRAYLDDPASHREARLRVVRELCAFTDGRSGERVARAIIAAASRGPVPVWSRREGPV